MSIENLKTSDPFAEAGADTGVETKQPPNGRETDQSQSDEDTKELEGSENTKKSQSQAQPLENLRTVDPSAEAEADTGEETDQSRSDEDTKKLESSKQTKKSGAEQTKQTKQPKGQVQSIENLKTFDPFAEADENTGETKKSQDYIHIRIQQRNGRKTLTTVQGLPKKFNQKKILKYIKKQFACNGNLVEDADLGNVIQLQGDQRKSLQEFLTLPEAKDGLGLKPTTIKVHGF